MRHQMALRKLGKNSAHRKAMFRNMVTSLIRSDRIETTLPKAKEIRRMADQMVTLAKKGTLAARRRAASYLQDPAVVQKLFSQLGERYQSRHGGYTRIVRLGTRRGDAADMAIIEYMPAEAPASTGKKTKKAPARKKPAA